MFKVYDIVQKANVSHKQFGVVIDTFTENADKEYYCAWDDGSKDIVKQEALRAVCPKDIIIMLRNIAAQEAGKRIQSVLIDDLLPVLKLISN